ncbi:MAG: hypothetical protein KJ749_13330 [Planctomycetes bacterium]|nr:hypothetical protein [Planctomycetota bacterium]
MAILVGLGSLLLTASAGWADADTSFGDDLAGMETEVSVTDRGRVRLFVEDEPLSTILRLLSVQSRRNIIASPNVKGTVTAHLFDVTFEEALQAILMANGAGYRTSGNFVYVYTLDELGTMEAASAEAAAGELVTRVFPLNYLSAADAQSYVEPLLGKDGHVSVSPTPATSLKGSAQDGGSNDSAAQDFIIVTARPKPMKEIERILREIDVQPRQVLVEATILRAELGDENALGIDFSIVGGVNLADLGTNSSDLIDLSLDQLLQQRFEKFHGVAGTDFAGDVPEGGITIGILKDQVAVFLRALEQVTDTTVLANPKVLTLNKQKAQVIVGRRDGFMTTTVTEIQAIQTVEFMETGTQLIFRPFIGNDGFVRMELHPEDSVGFVNAQGLPSEQTTEVTTNVIVRDGETILIGGLFREVTTDARGQVPGLGGLPILGALFKSTDNSTSREEVIILLTVHVVKDHSAYAAASLEQYHNVDRIRVGQRQGLMWHGRERVAQRHYQRALTAFTDGELKKALWHVNLALHNYGMMLPAIHLKERILQQRAWDDGASGGRRFLHRLIADEQGVDGPLLGRPRMPLEDPVPADIPAESGGEGPG